MAEVKIRAESCKSCGYCVHFCPKGVLEIGTQVNSKGYPYVTAAHPEKCIGCAMLPASFGGTLAGALYDGAGAYSGVFLVILAFAAVGLLCSGGITALDRTK